MPPRPRPPVRRGNRSLWIALALGGLLAAGLVAASVAMRDSGGSSGAEPTLSEGSSDLEGISQHGTVLGDRAAKVTLIEYADLSCPFCARYSTDVVPTLVDRYVRPGKLKLEFRGLAFLRPVENSERALRYALAAGAQNTLWDYVDRTYANQGVEGTNWFTEEFARSIAEQIPGLDADKLANDAGSDTVASEMSHSAEQARSDDVSGTPTFFLKVGSRPAYPIVVGELSPKEFTAAIDDALAG